MESNGEGNNRQLRANEETLGCHLSTIGIDDVFLAGPQHPLPLEYLSAKLDSTPSSFLSWELVGKIKTSPEDFCVREIFQCSRKIPGLSEEDMQRLRVADLIPGVDLPKQELKLLQTKEESQDSRANADIEKGGISVDEVKPRDAIFSFLKKVLPNEEEVTKMVQSLDKLQEIAVGRMESSTQSLGIASDQEQVWIPPLTSEDSSSPSLREARGTFHRAFKIEYPLLTSKSSTKDREEHWIMVKVDDSYDEILQHLAVPERDIKHLLVFQKKGFQEARVTTESHQSAASTSADLKKQGSVLLELKTTVSKDDRRTVHRVLAQKCKFLDTSTLTDFQANETTKTTAIKVVWQKNVIQRAQRKRKRGGAATGETNVYPNALFVLKKRQKEHLTAIQKVTRALHCRQSDIGFAGIKDLQAETYQFCTVRNMKKGRVLAANKHLISSAIELGNVFQVDWVLNNGHLDGNQFEIVVRDVRRVSVEIGSNGIAKEEFVECTQDHVANMVERLAKRGFINFFGEQRLGVPGKAEDVGVRAFEIGREMLRQNFSEAINLIMIGRSASTSRENTAALAVRKAWIDSSGDVAKTLKALQGGDFMARERMILKGLNRYGKDRPLDALRCLSHSMRIFWINAYQSLVWNKCASARIAQYGARVVKGDLYRLKDSTEVEVVNSDDHNIQLSDVLLPLPGYSIRYPENEIGQLYKMILQEDGVEFKRGAPVEATASGGYRNLVVQPTKLKFEMLSEDDIKFSFQLPKGCYATMCLRELMMTTLKRSTA